MPRWFNKKKSRHFLCRRLRDLTCVVLLLTMGACKKRATFSGHVVDFFTGHPLADVSMELNEQKFSLTEIGIGGGNSWHTVTDSDGNFAFHIKAYRKRREYRVQVDPEFFPDTIASFNKVFRAIPLGQISPALDENGGRDFLFTVAPAARVIIVMKRITTDPIDKWENGYLVNGDYFYINGTRNEPVPVSTAIVPCDGKIVLKFTKVSGGNETIKIDTLVVKPFELIRHHLFY